MTANSKQAEFIKAYEVCHERFVKYCSSLAFGKMDVQDLVQDVLVSAFEKFEKIEKKDELLHYLIRAARNRSVSFWRKRRNQVELTKLHQERLMDQGITPETILDIQILYSKLDQLPFRQKEAIILFEISGFSMKEIAVLQKSTEGAVKTKISRGRTKLAKMLDDRANLKADSVFNTLKSITL